MLITGQKGWWILKFKIPVSRRKEFFLSLSIILVGNTLGLGMYIQESRSSYTQSLPRKGFGEGTYEETLKVYTEKGSDEIQITVAEQKYSQEQIEDSLAEAYTFLSQWFQKNISGSDGILLNYPIILLNFSGVQMPLIFFPGMGN